MGTFLVTSHGRSGSAWLACELNKSPTWKVRHESTTKALVTVEHELALGRNEGEVDSRLRLVALDLWSRGEVDKIGVILRHPLAIVRSAAGRTPMLRLMQSVIPHLERDFIVIDDIAMCNDVVTIRFEDMTKSGAYLLDRARKLGIEDLDLDQVSFKPLNGPTSKPLPRELEKEVMRRVGWFARHWMLADV